jgi:hypothetical protein
MIYYLLPIGLYLVEVDVNCSLVVSAVENTCDFENGIVVFLGTKGVETPPRVSIPNV